MSKLADLELDTFEQAPELDLDFDPSGEEDFFDEANEFDDYEDHEENKYGRLSGKLMFKNVSFDDWN